MTGSLVPLVVVGEQAAYLPGPGVAHAVVGDVASVTAAAADLERREHPRWAVISAAAALRPLVAADVAVTRCWDLAEAHRLLWGRWRADPAYLWARLRGLDTDGMPQERRGDLFDLAAGPPEAADSPDRPVDASGYLRPDAFSPEWAGSHSRLLALASWVRAAAVAQRERLAEIGPRSVSTATSESAAAILCLELERDGLPLNRGVAERLVAEAAGPRPTAPGQAERTQRSRDEAVLRHAPPGSACDLRNPAHVRALLASAGVDVPTTRAAVLERYRSVSPLVDALLRWRKQERIATTYGYRWLDEHVGSDGRLRGTWTVSDGAAGRMTAQHGLHNLPAVLRPAVCAEGGHVFVRADLGQIEPRVLALLSGDPAFAAATRADDLYAPVAARLGVPRPVAKVAVLAGMYGQRSGPAGRAVDDLERAYPVAMGLLQQAYDAGVNGRELRTFGGRLVPLDTGGDPAARGRFARNALVQGSAAELFKAWAATVRHAVAPLGGQIVLCLHDELLVHAPETMAPQAAWAVRVALRDSVRRWAGTEAVRFVADVSVVRTWGAATPQAG
ncbi:MAG: DNA polymerase [Dermatophilaceae bacterium]